MNFIELDKYGRSGQLKELRSARENALRLEKKGELSDKDFNEWQSKEVPSFLLGRLEEKFGQPEMVGDYDKLEEEVKKNFTNSDTKEYKDLVLKEDKGGREKFIFDRLTKSQQRDLFMLNADDKDSQLFTEINIGSQMLTSAREDRLRGKAENEILDERIAEKKREAAREKERSEMSLSEEIDKISEIDSKVK